MIRQLTTQDLPELARLRTSAQASAEKQHSVNIALTQLYPHLLMDSPWYDPDVPSLVSTAQDGSLTGMLAIGCRPLEFQGRTIRAAIGADLFVAEESRSSMAGVVLMKELLNGPQDVTFCDIANNSTRRLWERLGGFVASSYNVNWLGILRPTQLVADQLSGRSGLGWLRNWSRPATSVLDRILPGNLQCRVDEVADGLVAAELTPGDFSRDLPEVLADAPVRPVYSREAAEWTWQRLPYLSPDAGDISAVVLRNSRDRLLGWYIYKLAAGGLARVLQLAAPSNQVPVVLNHLLHRVREEGACAVMGRMQAQHRQAVIDHGCLLRGRSTYALAHSRDPELAQAYLSGHAWLSILDGEAPLNAWNSPHEALADLVSRPRTAHSLAVIDSV